MYLFGGHDGTRHLNDVHVYDFEVSRGIVLSVYRHLMKQQRLLRKLEQLPLQLLLLLKLLLLNLVW